ncbi:siphovirus Gp157 family protein [Alcanivoracaceae bacterium MT1]
MTGLSLYHMTDEYLAALDHLRDMDLDEETMSDTLEGLEGELTIKAQNVAAFTLNLDAEAAAIKEAEQRLARRRRALENKVKKLRDYLLVNMERAGISEISAIDNSFRVRVMKGRQSVVIDDMDALPADYTTTKTIVDPDKRLITKAISDGYEVPGAHLERKPQLKID